MRLPLGDVAPRVSETAWVAPNATLVGDVLVDDAASIWYGTVLRADCGPVIIGERANVQDNCVLHTDPGDPVQIGTGVSIGHHAVVHACTVEDHTLIGMGAILLSGARIGAGSMVAAGSVVSERYTVPDGVLAAGAPARVKRPLTPEEQETIRANAFTYARLAAQHARSIRTSNSVSPEVPS